MEISNTGYKSSNNFEESRPFHEKRRVKITKRRIVGKEECIHDNWSFLIDCFKCITLAIDKYNNTLSGFAPEIRVRNFEAVLLMQLITKEFIGAFPEHCNFTRYRRFVVSINGYQFFPKKLNYKNMPMNIVTAFSSKLYNQVQGNLFNDDPAYEQAMQPILYIGYRKDRFGSIGDLKVVYVDENKLQWTINKDDLDAFMSTNSLRVLNPMEERVIKKEPKFKDKGSVKRAK